ncbi:hypothetical protein ACFYZU_33795 [Streptomyces sp. NPDC001651]|uniref:hypothetical protein n=1 Tax=Streptomyces sp. NPDC001651 TaxID=3364596 RepID=UPI0036CE8FA0
MSFDDPRAPGQGESGGDGVEVMAEEAGEALHGFRFGLPDPLLQQVSAPQIDGELVPPIQAAVDFSFTPIELDHSDPFGVALVPMEADGRGQLSHQPDRSVRL